MDSYAIRGEARADAPASLPTMVGRHGWVLRLHVATGSAACGHRQTQHPQKLILGSKFDDHGSAYALL